MTDRSNSTTALSSMQPCDADILVAQSSIMDVSRCSNSADTIRIARTIRANVECREIDQSVGTESQPT
ncbi:MAG: hypothetical protein AAGG48_24300 [Planctomycetota bacterium]